MQYKKSSCIDKCIYFISISINGHTNPSRTCRRYCEVMVITLQMKKIYIEIGKRNDSEKRRTKSVEDIM